MPEGSVMPMMPKTDQSKRSQELLDVPSTLRQITMDAAAPFRIGRIIRCGVQVGVLLQRAVEICTPTLSKQVRVVGWRADGDGFRGADKVMAEIERLPLECVRSESDVVLDYNVMA